MNVVRFDVNINLNLKTGLAYALKKKDTNFFDVLILVLEILKLFDY